MTCLPDVNVWVALAVGEHIHNVAARRWFDDFDERVVFCRVTQMALLRLLTNRHVLRGDALSPTRAWDSYDKFMEDGRISWVGEPAGLDHHWHASTTQERQGSNWWTDTYLAAFASAAGFTLITFDAQLASRKNVSTLLLK